jgi:hypothetical protein
LGRSLFSFKDDEGKFLDSVDILSAGVKRRCGLPPPGFHPVDSLEAGQHLFKSRVIDILGIFISVYSRTAGGKGD